MPRFVLGVDGGGSKSTALIAAADAIDVVLGRGMAGGSNYQTIGADAMFAALSTAIDAACAEAGINRSLIDAVCLGLAGADRAADRALLRDWAAGIFPAARVRIVNDAMLLLSAGNADGWGLALISGTGSIAYGRAPDGATGRAGGWGSIFGDEGSGYAIGVAALRAVTHAADGRGSATELTAAVLAHWSLPDASALINRVYRHNASRAEIAALARLVDAAAQHGDVIADDIMRTAASELATAAAAVVRALNLRGPIPCSLAGGVLLGSARLRDYTLAACAGYGLAFAPVSHVSEPARGALRIAATIGSDLSPTADT
jgi:N-acetylglucosamine kinase-like BadF-type ATPase